MRIKSQPNRMGARHGHVTRLVQQDGLLSGRHEPWHREGRGISGVPRSSLYRRRPGGRYSTSYQACPQNLPLTRDEPLEVA